MPQAVPLHRSAAAMPRDLVVCFDGTNNEFGKENTNVVRLVQALVRDPRRQRVYYDPGIGTLPEPGFATRIGKRLSAIAGLAFGAGLDNKIAGGYRYLMENWRPGDRVFVFGFSRGAYTARALASLLHMFGLLTNGSQNFLPYLLRKFMSSSREYGSDGACRKPGGGSEAGGPGVEPAGPFADFCSDWRKTFAMDHPDRPDRRFPVHFLGVWDTVKSVGWVWEPLSLPFTAFNPSVRVVRHAIAIDERRAFFRQNRFTPGGAGTTQDLVERWFPGVHADVGGGYPEEDGALWRIGLCWMVTQAHAQHLAFDAGQLAAVLRCPDAAARVPAPSIDDVLAAAGALCAWKAPAHESLTPGWWLGEVFPKLTRQRVDTGQGPRWRNVPRLNLGARRCVPADATLDDSVVERILAVDGYRPPNLVRTGFPDTSNGRKAKDLIGPP